jgi:hypothetical protein
MVASGLAEHGRKSRSYGLGALGRQRDALSHMYSCTVDGGDVDELELADAGS